MYKYYPYNIKSCNSHWTRTRYITDKNTKYILKNTCYHKIECEHVYMSNNNENHRKHLKMAYNSFDKVQSCTFKNLPPIILGWRFNYDEIAKIRSD